MPELLNENLLLKYLRGQTNTHPNKDELVRLLTPWVRLASGEESAITEVNVDLLFLQTFFVKTLGYVMPPGETFTLFPKKALETHDIPDFRLGRFTDKDGQIVGQTFAAGEIKGHQRNLDRVDPKYGESPVQQAFRYGRRSGLDVVWVLVSNMKEIRLYRVNSELHYTSFMIAEFIHESRLTDSFWRFYHLMRGEALLSPVGDNPIAKLAASSIEQRVRLTDAFYRYYRQILSDVFIELIRQHPSEAATASGKDELARAAQQFLHRGLMICFMSDHPSWLLDKNLLDDWIKKAASNEVLGNRIYPSLRALFQYIDKGERRKGIFGYDGGLFRYNPYLDSDKFELPDALFSKEYKMNGKKMNGVYGFREIDFYNELSPHLLGRLFENSIADQEEIFRRINSGVAAEKLVHIQSDLGIVYTREILAEFASKSALEAIFSDIRTELLREMKVQKLEGLAKSRAREYWIAYLNRLKALRVVDLSVGSGAFLVECYKELKREAELAYEMSKPEVPATVEDYFDLSKEILDHCFFGKDILPGAIAVAELALWLASAQKDVKLTNFQDNFIVGDTLGPPGQFPKVEAGGVYQEFDLVIGNPPWGGEVSSTSLSHFRSIFPEAQEAEQMNTFEMFLHVGTQYLKRGGRLCYVLPQSMLYSEKFRTRGFILENFTLEKWHYLGAEWFGPEVRMNTTLLQLKNEPPAKNSRFHSMTLAGNQRKRAISGEVPLEQLETSLASAIPQERCRSSAKYEVELFRYAEDDRVMKRMESFSRSMVDVCFRSRGVELNKAGEIIQCPACFEWDAPPAAKKGIPSEKLKKTCSHCGHSYLPTAALSRKTIVTETKQGSSVPYVDGDSIERRYSSPTYRWITAGADGVNYKGADTYRDPKVLIRKTGMGLIAAYDEKGAYCPQTVFIYRPSDKNAITSDEHAARKSWSDIFSAKFLLGILHSRVLSYYFLKKHGEIDNAQAFSHVTHTKLASLPIPVRNWETNEWRKDYRRVIELVDKMLGGAPNGGSEDYELEMIISRLYGLDGEDRAHIIAQFGLVEYHRAIRELFPERPPMPEKYSSLSPI